MARFFYLNWKICLWGHLLEYFINYLLYGTLHAVYACVSLKQINQNEGRGFEEASEPVPYGQEICGFPPLQVNLHILPLLLN